MLKAPIPGFCKTRLAADLGDAERAAEIYRALVEKQIREIPPGLDVVVHYTPQDAGPAMREWLGSGFRYEPQPEGDLGARLVEAMESAFLSGARSVMFLGGDCPAFETRHFAEVAQLLKLNEIVLVPATDGGYCMLATRAREPRLFDDIPWSTERVFEATMRRAAECGFRVALMEEMEDVDDLESYQRAIASNTLGAIPSIG
jgi:rSAM/selenodomain-associated transferase 1